MKHANMAVLILALPFLTASCDQPKDDPAGETVRVAGDLVITEIMYDSTAVADPPGEWFELYNPTQVTFDLYGLVFTDLSATPEVRTVASHLLMRPGEFLTFANDGTALASPDYIYGGSTVEGDTSQYALGNTSDEIIIMAGDTEIDRVAWDDSLDWPAASGASIFLVSVWADNSLAENWEISTHPVAAGGDAGTPGMPN